MQDYFYGLTGRIVTPFNPIYNEARQGFNRAIQQYPLIIIYCMNKWDVQNAVLWANRMSIPIRIRSGGHNYEGYSNGNCTLVIDISNMNYMKIMECTNRLYTEGGVTNKQIYEYTFSKGYPFPGGTCPKVGVSGYVLGGGWGLSCRNFGLGCDSLEEIELVNYKGELIRANNKYNSDLFWACRGAGGGNYGVIVSMSFKLPPKIEKVTLIEIDYRNVSQEEQKELLFTWQEWLKNADQRMTLISRIYNSSYDGYAMLIRGFFYGKPREAKEIITNFLAIEGAVFNIEYMPFLDAVTIIGSTYPPYERFQSGSRFVVRDFNSKEVSDVVELIEKRAEGSVFAGISMYALGGRVSDIQTDQSAFYYRNAKYIIWLETVWEENKYASENREWISQQFPHIAKLTTGSYVNFPYKNLPNYLEQYYGNHVMLLREVKIKYDPKNVFRFPQGIEKSNEISYASSIIEKFQIHKKRETLLQADDAIYRGFRYVVKDK